ncbi:Double-stranded RNA-binding domain protein [Kalmanozyma brasiliensis GHG001]|uniref:DRBM domain-containing protein n=1 Tax=Kalmanozyma brasiliensis (strain GHG001) TaxID=1365824 RepID=V5F0S9_KALBG|nr:Double-stranded RNA-binding domain protein [Kalmanozyma brasiliensis GHG001]EST08864.1 Double-stranded RNA-binding domain protein [Kalmanozyma brasiliensis GHG001]
MTNGTNDHELTSANLAAAGGKSIPDYLREAFPEADTSQAANVASSSKKGLYETLSGKPLPEKGSVIPSPSPPDDDEEGRDLYETPFYIKVRGKGKGKAVLFEKGRSSVAQIHEWAAQMNVEDPVFTHTSSGAAHLLAFTVTVNFDGLIATSPRSAGSIKDAKELACADLAEQILLRNRDVFRLKA